MKILFLTDGIYPFCIGGMQKHSLMLAGQLAEKGVYVHLVHCGGEGYEAAVFRNQFSEAANRNLEETLVAFPRLKKIPGHYIRENQVYADVIYKKFESRVNDFDLVYAQGFTGHKLIEMKRAGSHSVPVCVNLHGFEMFQYAANFKVKLQYLLLKKEARYHINNADYIYSFGGKLNELLQQEGVPKVKILHQSNGIDQSWLVNGPAAHAVRNFLFIGRNERRKGITELSAALRLICKGRSAPFKFHFIGPIEDAAKVKDARIVYHGELRDRDSMQEIIDQCDFLVCPSYAEGMPTVILEAMARGLAIIATNVGAVSCQVKGNGILLANPAVDKLQSAILNMINLPEADLSDMKQKSLDLVKSDFLWSEVAKEKIAGFRRITGKD